MQCSVVVWSSIVGWRVACWKAIMNENWNSNWNSNWNRNRIGNWILSSMCSTSNIYTYLRLCALVWRTCKCREGDMQCSRILAYYQSSVIHVSLFACLFVCSHMYLCLYSKVAIYIYIFQVDLIWFDLGEYCMYISPTICNLIYTRHLQRKLIDWNKSIKKRKEKKRETPRVLGLEFFYAFLIPDNSNATPYSYSR